MAGLTASPNRCDMRIWIASAVDRLAGTMVYWCVCVFVRVRGCIGSTEVQWVFYIYFIYQQHGSHWRPVQTQEELGKEHHCLQECVGTESKSNKHSHFCEFLHINQSYSMCGRTWEVGKFMPNLISNFTHTHTLYITLWHHHHNIVTHAGNSKLGEFQALTISTRRADRVRQSCLKT